MKARNRSRTVRRSVALQRKLVDEVAAVAPPELRKNLNRLVTVALKEYAAARKVREFEEAMAQMARDPAMQKESASISNDFVICEADGITDDPER